MQERGAWSAERGPLGGFLCGAASRHLRRERVMQRPGKYLALLAVVLLPSPVFAQPTWTGTVRDNSGGILPGVTVEAASPALIEKVKTAVTDDSGQYRIVDLRAGTYTLT